MNRSGLPIRTVLAFALFALLLAACAPTAAPTGESTSGEGLTGSVPPAATTDPVSGPNACASEEPPVVAIIDFDNTTSRFGITVTGLEEAATARLITLLKESGCYVVVEKSVLQEILEQQGLESLDPVSLAKAAGAAYVITGTVTRATIAKPQVSVGGITIGNTSAEVEVDVRATDIITGEVVVSMTGAGEASSPNIAVSRIPTAGTISFNDPTVGPLLAEASEKAIMQVVAAIRPVF